jgi:hypothetical protein
VAQTVPVEDVKPPVRLRRCVPARPLIFLFAPLAEELLHKQAVEAEHQRFAEHPEPHDEEGPDEPVEPEGGQVVADKAHFGIEGGLRGEGVPD